jgi:hypothetical protein
MQNNNVLVFNVLFFNALQALCFDNGMFSGFVAVFCKLFGNGECFFFQGLLIVFCKLWKICGDYYRVEEGMNFCYSFLVTLFVHI